MVAVVVVAAPADGGGDVVGLTERVAAMTHQGMSARKIAAMLGVSSRTVQRYRRRAGVSRPQNQPLTGDQLRWIDALLADGCSYREVARTVGCDYQTLRARFPGRGWTPAQIGQMNQVMRVRL